MNRWMFLAYVNLHTNEVMVNIIKGLRIANIVLDLLIVNMAVVPSVVTVENLFMVKMAPKSEKKHAKPGTTNVATATNFITSLPYADPPNLSTLPLQTQTPQQKHPQ